MKKLKRPSMNGFSLLELIIVIVIIGVVTAVAMPKFAHAGSGRRLSAAKKTLLSDIAMVKLRARATSRVHLIKFYPDEEIYIIVEGTEITRDSIILSRDLKVDPFNLGISRTSLGVNPYATITVYGDVSPGFSIGIIDDGVEIPVVVDGVADVGLSIVESIVDIQYEIQQIGLGN